MILSFIYHLRWGFFNFKIILESFCLFLIWFNITFILRTTAGIFWYLIPDLRFFRYTESPMISISLAPLWSPSSLNIISKFWFLISYFRFAFLLAMLLIEASPMMVEVIIGVDVFLPIGFLIFVECIDILDQSVDNKGQSKISPQESLTSNLNATFRTFLFAK